MDGRVRDLPAPLRFAGSVHLSLSLQERKSAMNVSAIPHAHPYTCPYIRRAAVTDQADIPADLRGYVQLALDRGILDATFTTSPLAAEVQPSAPVTRAALAAALVDYRQAFAAGD
jgi:hypothetical protein